MVERQFRDRLADFALELEEGEVARTLLEEWPSLRDSAEDDEGVSAMFLPYLIHDRTTSTGATPFERFVARHGAELSPSDGELLQKLHWGRWGVFEVSAVRPGQGVDFRDLSDGTTFEIRDYSASVGLSRWLIALTRIYPARGAWVGDGGMLLLDPELQPELERGLVELGAPLTSPAFQESLRRRLPAIHTLMSGLNQRSAIERVITPEGDPVAVATATFRCADPRLLSARLEAHPDLYPSDREAGRRFFNWARPESSIPRASDSGNGRTLISMVYLVDPTDLTGPEGNKLVNLGTVSIEGGRVRLECLSAPRLSKLEELVAGLGIPIVPESRKVTPFDPAAVRASGPGGSRRTSPRQRPRAEPPGAESVRRKLAEEFLEKWPEEPVPALGGLTPREAAKDPLRRPALVGLLKSFEVHTQVGGGPIQLGEVRRLAALLGVRELLEAPSRS